MLTNSEKTNFSVSIEVLCVVEIIFVLIRGKRESTKVIYNHKFAMRPCLIIKYF